MKGEKERKKGREGKIGQKIVGDVEKSGMERGDIEEK